MDKEERLLFEQRVDAFHKVLLKFTKKDDLVHLGQRLLQKVPEVRIQKLNHFSTNTLFSV